MRVLKYIVAFILPILLLINLWRFVMGNTDEVGFRFAVDYTSTYRGWQSTVSFFQYMYSLANVDNAGEAILLVLSPLWAPVAIGIAILSDILYHIGFFFGWLTSSVFGSDLTINPDTSSWNPVPISMPMQ